MTKPVLKCSISTVKRNFAWREPVRPFISSTFVDFEEERDHLVRRIFPQLNSLCHSRGTYFAPADLRWGINEEQSQSGHVISLCLDYINQCTPFFICLLGERYGSHRPNDAPPLPASYRDLPDNAPWLDVNFLKAAANGHKWVLQDTYQRSSITELEIIQAAYLNDSKYCRFYFRDVRHTADKFLKVFEKERQEKLKPYLAEDEEAELRVRDLKRHIVARGLPVKFYFTAEELGMQVLEDWSAIINEVYPPLQSFLSNVGSELFHEWAAHEAYAETRRRVFIKTEGIKKLYEELDHHVQYAIAGDMTEVETSFSISKTPSSARLVNQRSIFTLVGASGCGKSAILANWVKSIQEQNPKTQMIAHFVGSSATSGDIASFLRRATYELRGEYTGMETKTSSDTQDLSDFHRICEAFVAAISLGPCVLVLDGIDELGSTLGLDVHQVKQLPWLPVHLPKHCQFVISTVRSDLTYKCLSQRDDTTVYTVPLFDSTGDKGCVIEDILAVHCKHLDQSQVDKVARSKLSDRPLYLSILANELRVGGTYRNLEQLLDQYVSADSFRDLWRCVIGRWTKDYGWDLESSNSQLDDLSGWVADMLKLIACSHHGLSETELLEILGMMGYSGHLKVTIFDFAMLRSATFDALFERPGGLMNFFHLHLKEAVEFSLLGFLGGSGLDSSLLGQNHLLRQCHEVLANYFWKQPPSLRRVEELTWQLEKCGDMHRLLQVVTDPNVFLIMCGDGSQRIALRLDLVRYWQHLVKNGYDPAVAYVDMVKEAAKMDSGEGADGLGVAKKRSDGTQTPVCCSLDVQDESLCHEYEPEERCKVALLGMHAGKFLAEKACFKEAESLLTLAVQHIGKKFPLSTPEQMLLVQIQESLADLHFYQLDKVKALSFYQKALDTLDTIALGETDALYPHLMETKGRLLNRVGLMKARDNLLRKGESILMEARNCMRRANSLAGLATTQFNLGQLKVRKKEFENGENCLREALKTRERWNGKSHPLVAEVLDVLAGVLCNPHNIHRCDGIVAEAFYRRALKVREQSYGQDHLLVATSLFHLGKLLKSSRSRHCKTEAVSLLKHALDIRTTKLGSSHKLSYAVRQILKQIQTQLRVGDYDYAPIKQPDKRTKDNPNSALTRHDQDSLKFKKCLRKRSAKSTQIFFGVQIDQRGERVGGILHKRCTTRNESLSASDELTRPRANSTPIGVDHIDVELSSWFHQDLHVTCSEQSRAKAAEDAYGNVHADRTRNTRARFSPDVETRSKSDSSRQKSPSPSASTRISGCSRFTESTPAAKFGRESHSCSNLRADSRISYTMHHSHCDVPGQFDLHPSNAKTICGPHSHIHHLLGDPPCPRDFGPKTVHKAAWYHEPNRYPKNAYDVYPPRRHQARPGNGHSWSTL